MIHMRLASFRQTHTFSLPIPSFFHSSTFQAAFHGKPLIMAIFSLLMAFCFLTGYLTVGIASLTLPLNQGLDSIDSLTTLSLNVSSPAVQEFCTSSLIWVGSTSCDSQLTTDCFLAWKSFMTDFAEYKNVQFEFLQQGVTPAYPGLVKMATPRRYINSESTLHVGDKGMWLIIH